VAKTQRWVTDEEH